LLYLDSFDRTTLAALPSPKPSAFAEAVAWFRARVPVNPNTYRELTDRVRRRAFTVARATALETLAHVWRALDRAVAQGTTFTEFKRGVQNDLAQHTRAQLDNVFRNNVQVAYSAGRYAQSTDPLTLADRPFWRFEAILDSRTTPICRPLDGLTLPASDPFWRVNYPPLHHSCRSGVTCLTEEDAAHERFTSVPPDAHGPQQGWGAAPGTDEWAPDPQSYPAPLWNAYQQWGERMPR
jgi:SPP1 gp7 family putative phage head morphogenesis protein